jgi:cytoskeletal protein CcmA (bactofilin family)
MTNRSKIYRILLALLLLTAISLALLPGRNVRAVEFTQNGNIPADQVVNDDLFISTEKAQIDGTVNGDLFINCSSAIINGTVNGNLIVNSASLVINGVVNGSVVFAGQTAEFNGEINGSVYAAGASLVLAPESRVQRNVFAAAFSLESQPGSIVGIDLSSFAYQTLVYGETQRDVNASVVALEIGGIVGRNVNADVEPPESDQPSFQFPIPGAPATVPSGLRVTEDAVIGGKITYISTENQDEAILSQPQGGIVYKPRTQQPSPAFSFDAGDWLAGRFRELATLTILGLVAAWLAPEVLRGAGEQARLKPLRSAGWGLLAIIAGFVGVGLAALLILLGGILIGIVSLGGLSRAVFWIGIPGLISVFSMFLLLVVYGSKVVVAFLAGQKIVATLAPGSTERRFTPIIIGVIVYSVLAAIPLLGLLVGLSASLVGTGAIWLLYKDRLRRKKTAITPAE